MNFSKSLLYSLTVCICLFTIGCNSSKNENVKQENANVKTENKSTADVKPSNPKTTHVTKESKSDDQGQQNLPLDAFVSSSKMNILYRGIDNPINVSVSGVSSD
ncbi:GldM family protein, partial [Marinifilum flexuosum]|uniref:GldM family protein n=1 Tax=Marinifilum flexuosum TaxID=1117708 RepID=UPI0024948742